jgi:hypothetical protein
MRIGGKFIYLVGEIVAQKSSNPLRVPLEKQEGLVELIGFR